MASYTQILVTFYLIIIDTCHLVIVNHLLQIAQILRYKINPP